ncbi:MAG: efflux RND transporter permease subunit [Deltaproteobacteria bacterium]|jgi:multidrug efflux pump subunit AcrB|nr:efflux RND transporter permease subunit [Deltaproteobacteria bacterium]MBT4264762.1 efflux RND transporter permease subunit [Deltaproteobacteria bacterium]MBT4640470.1 efflux RND transporter permease subunit [Deltaproteobacteria bacterium]MBT6502928.1 efflux RND transporter permease subunit [Deltaproteobacteria bacterium]MBT7154431.1 efflux RND transporter permease subunit [Deltaproteobacteria bacterium]
MKNIIAIYARNTVFANILMVIIILSGLVAASKMIREFFPEFSLDLITITIVYPGANPEEVEEGISRKVESAIEAIEGVKQYTTKSMENVSLTTIEVTDGYSVDKVLDRVRSNINGIATFPVNAEKPVITDLSTQESVMIMGLSGDISERRLKEWAENMKDEIVALPQVSRANIFGVRNYEIAIEVSEKTLQAYGLTFSQVVNTIRRENLNLAGGTIKTKGEEIRIRTVGRKYTGEDLKNIVILARPSGEMVTLDKLAVIHDGFTEAPILATINGERAVLLSIIKTSIEDTLTITNAMNKFINQKKTQLPEGVGITIIYETSVMLRARINLLLKNGVIGLVLVFLILWMFLDLRLSFWSGMGIPISLAGGFVILWGVGGTVNMISLFGFLMVLGIVVDDAIVVGEAIFYHRTQGKSALNAVVEGVSEVGMPVVAAVTTTIVAFLPLMYVGGIMGKFIAILPVVVIACLAISLLECLLLLPAHLNHLPDPRREVLKRNKFSRWIHSFHELTAKGLLWLIKKTYIPFLRKALHWRYIALSVAIAILLLCVGFIRAGIIKFEVMPEVDGFIMIANVEFPNGTPVSITQKAVKQVEEALVRMADKTKTKTGEPLLKDRLVMVGQAAGGSSSGPHLGGIIVTMIASEQRGIHSKDIRIAWEKEVGAIPGIKTLKISGMGGGPPGAPIEVWVQGQNLDQILLASEDLKARLRQFDGTFQIQTDFSQGKNEIRLELKPEARTLGLTVNDLATQVYTGYFGEDAVRIQRGRDDIRIKVRYSASERERLSDFRRIRIRTNRGYEVPLHSVARITFAPGFSTITRSNGMRRVVVSSEVDNNKTNANEIVSEMLKSYIPDLAARYPRLRFTFQGEKKRMSESFSSLYIGYPLAMIGIFFIIATMFRSYVQPLLISMTIPFGLIGAILGHLVLGYNFTMMSIFGVVALAGVVVNDAIVLIERVNENLAEGMPFLDAILNAGARRFRAIFLTTISTVGGLAPLIMETDFQAKFLIPMAISIAAGVGFATVLTLVLLPSLYMILNDLRRAVFWIKQRTMPVREAVEPASKRRIREPETQLPRPAGHS